MLHSNFHTHTHYSDGKAPMETYCTKAIELGFHSLGFSDHAPVKFDNSFSIPPEKLSAYFKEVQELKKKYENQLNIYLSLEADYIPGFTFAFNEFRNQAPIDYLIGSIHLVHNGQNNETWFIDGGDQEVWDKGLKEIFGGAIEKGVRSFYEQTMEMIEIEQPEVLGHLDKIKMHNKQRLFDQREKWYLDLIDATLQTVKRHQIVLEVNTRGIYKGRCLQLFPSPEIALKAQKKGIPLMLSSDAHHPDELNGAFDQALEWLKNAGIKSLVDFSSQGWKEISLS